MKALSMPLFSFMFSLLLTVGTPAQADMFNSGFDSIQPTRVNNAYSAPADVPATEQPREGRGWFSWGNRDEAPAPAKQDFTQSVRSEYNLFATPDMPTTTQAIVPAAGQQVAPSRQVAPAQARPTMGGNAGGEYRLGSGDKIRLIVFGEEDLSGEYEVDSRGIISLPLIGQVSVGGYGTSNAEDMIAQKLSDGYLVNPRVSMEVLNFRPFYIVGEVKEPGNYPYVSGMTVLNAIAIANGYTYRANKKAMEIRRTENGRVSEFKGTEATVIQPGDVIHVKERWF